MHVSMEKRLEILGDCVEHHLLRIQNGLVTGPIEIHKLFYDDDSDSISDNHGRSSDSDKCDSDDSDKSDSDDSDDSDKSDYDDSDKSDSDSNFNDYYMNDITIANDDETDAKKAVITII